MSKKPLVINTIATAVGFFINIGINFILSPYIIEAVGVEAYGFIGLANNFISYASILTIALNSMAGRFITISLHNGNVEKSNKYFNSILSANIMIAILLVGISIISIRNINSIIHVPDNLLFDVKLLFLFLSINLIIGVVGAVFGIATFATNKLYLTSLRGIEGNFIRVIILACLFSIFKPTIFYLGLTTVIVTIYSISFNIYYTRKLLPQIELSTKYYDLESILQVGSAGIWNVFIKISTILSTGLDLLITNLSIGSIAMGTLSVSKTIPSMILGIFGMLAGVFAPELTIAYAKGDINKMKEQLVRAIKFLGVLSSIPMCLLLVYGDRFYNLWVPTQDISMIHLLSIIGCVELIFVLPLEPLWNIFTVTNNIKKSSLYLFINSISCVFIVFIGLSIIKSYEMKLIIITATSMVFGIIRAIIFLPIYASRCLNLKWYTFYPYIIKNTLSVLILSTIALKIKSIININNWIDLIFVGGAVGILGIIINIYLVFNRKERLTIYLRLKKM